MYFIQLNNGLNGQSGGAFVPRLCFPHPGTHQPTRPLSKMDDWNVPIVFSKPPTISHDTLYVSECQNRSLQFGMVPGEQIVLQLQECPLSNETDPSAGNRSAK